MLSPLLPHPGCTPPPGLMVSAGLVRTETTRWRLVHRLRGPLDQIRLPSPGTLVRMDDLWRTTCFEAFLQPHGAPYYVERNVAPSYAFAAYRFDTYRSKHRDAWLEPGSVWVERSGGKTEIEVAVSFELAEPGFRGAVKAGLSCVVEDAGGRLSYWALAHPGARPDFHNADAFTLSV
jgi:hypothetical protein